MSSQWIRTFFLLISTAVVVVAARADLLKLQNGDHISGKVEKFVDGKLSFKTVSVGVCVVISVCVVVLWYSEVKQLIEKGEIGEIKLGNFIFAFPGVESFHPNPEPWFREGGGPIMDMGPYFYTMLVNFLGPAKSVMARSTKGSEKRIIASGVDLRRTQYAWGH